MSDSMMVNFHVTADRITLIGWTPEHGHEEVTYSLTPRLAAYLRAAVVRELPDVPPPPADRADREREATALAIRALSEPAA